MPEETFGAMAHVALPHTFSLLPTSTGSKGEHTAHALDLPLVALHKRKYTMPSSIPTWPAPAAASDESYSVDSTLYTPVPAPAPAPTSPAFDTSIFDALPLDPISSALRAARARSYSIAPSVASATSAGARASSLDLPVVDDEDEDATTPVLSGGGSSSSSRARRAASPERRRAPTRRSSSSSSSSESCASTDTSSANSLGCRTPESHELWPSSTSAEEEREVLSSLDEPLLVAPPVRPARSSRRRRARPESSACPELGLGITTEASLDASSSTSLSTSASALDAYISSVQRTNSRRSLLQPSLLLGSINGRSRVPSHTSTPPPPQKPLRCESGEKSGRLSLEELDAADDEETAKERELRSQSIAGFFARLDGRLSRSFARDEAQEATSPSALHRDSWASLLSFVEGHDFAAPAASGASEERKPHDAAQARSGQWTRPLYAHERSAKRPSRRPSSADDVLHEEHAHAHLHLRSQPMSRALSDIERSGHDSSPIFPAWQQGGDAVSDCDEPTLAAWTIGLLPPRRAPAPPSCSDHSSDGLSSRWSSDEEDEGEASFLRSLRRMQTRKSVKRASAILAPAPPPTSRRPQAPPPLEALPAPPPPAVHRSGTLWDEATPKAAPVPLPQTPLAASFAPAVTVAATNQQHQSSGGKTRESSGAGDSSSDDYGSASDKEASRDGAQRPGRSNGRDGDDGQDGRDPSRKEPASAHAAEETSSESDTDTSSESEDNYGPREHGGADASGSTDDDIPLELRAVALQKSASVSRKASTASRKAPAPNALSKMSSMRRPNAAKGLDANALSQRLENIRVDTTRRDSPPTLQTQLPTKSPSHTVSRAESLRKPVKEEQQFSQQASSGKLFGGSIFRSRTTKGRMQSSRLPESGAPPPLPPLPKNLPQHIAGSPDLRVPKELPSSRRPSVSRAQPPASPVISEGHWGAQSPAAASVVTLVSHKVFIGSRQRYIHVEVRQDVRARDFLAEVMASGALSSDEAVSGDWVVFDVSSSLGIGE